MKNLMAVVLLLVMSTASLANEWEYMVVYLPPAMDMTKMKPTRIESNLVMDGDVLLDVAKANTLNQYAQRGWELYSVVAENAISHVAYLRRPLKK
jgi:hypothetical protein